MPKSRIIVVLGLLVALLPVFGFPRLWESFFQVGVGLLIVILSIWASIDKHLTLKAKAQKRQTNRRHIERRAADIEAARLVEPITQEDQSI